ncbi:MAG TPA: TonB-dependent receptor [Candidatus Acidoferrum sp.]|jgi:hypothetical protein|nr:TonB-dependent receptor [Candidatus Acidoferrum sp.]
MKPKRFALSSKFFTALVFGILPLVSVTLPLYAQIDRAVLEGTVTDPSGRVIAGATVRVLAPDTGLTQDQLTNARGYYRFPGLAVGHYKVTVSETGFKTKTIDDVTVQVGQTRTLDIGLDVGAINERIEVKASSAPADRSSAEASTVITTDQIGNLPNNGRDWASFTLLAPFAQDDGGGDQRTIRFAGRARDDNNFSFDGVDAGGIQEQAQKSQTRLQISQDAIEEYRVNSALYDAEYGTQAGGQIDVVTKSGTNNFHGSAFGYLRNSIFDARNFNDLDLSGNPVVPPFRMGQYGMTFGGPIVKDKLFFFVNYEGLRQYQAASSNNQVVVPSPSIQQSTLTNPNLSAQQIGQMCSILQAFPWRVSTGSIGGCIPKFVFPDGAFNNTGQPSDSDLFTNPAVTTVHEDTWLARIDYVINARTTLYGRAQRDISLVDAPDGSSVPSDKLQTINHPANYFLALQQTLSPRVLNEVKVFVNRSPFINPQSSPLNYAVHTNNWVTINNDNADHEVGTTYGVIDNLTWARGRNTFKTGMEIRRVRLNQGKTADNNLSFQDSTSSQDSGFVNAQLYGISFTSPWCCHKYRRTFYMPYFQDEWKARPNLTLNLGLRWEYYGVAHEADNRTTVFDLNEFHGVCLGSGSTNGPYPAPINTPPCPRNPALYNSDYRNFDPRVGFAWAPGMFHGNTVIRSGFGIYHGAAQNDDLNAGLESDRFAESVSFPTQDANGNPVPGTPLLPAFQQEIPDLTSLANSVTRAGQHPRGLQRHGRRDLYAEVWGLTIEHELPANLLASAQYLGSRGVRLFSRGAVNLCITKPDSSGNCIRPLDQYFPDPSGQSPTLDPYGSVDYKSDIGASTYHALLLSLERRFASGLSFQTRYTWSHSINDGSVGGGESNGPENVNCLPCDKGPSVFDVRSNFTVNAVYELPIGPGKAYLNDSGVLGKIVGGWSFSSVGLWHTGHPLTVTYSVSPTQLPDENDQTTQRPDLIPGVPLTLPGGGRNGVPIVNPAAFQAPPVDSNGIQTRFGNAPNGVVRALNSWQIDLALMKETKLTERVRMEFGVQVFNIFNHIQLGDPSVLSLSPDSSKPNGLSPDSNFGIIDRTVNFNNNNDNAASPNTGTGLPRQIQFMLRLDF